MENIALAIVGLSLINLGQRAQNFFWVAAGLGIQVYVLITIAF